MTPDEQLAEKLAPQKLTLPSRTDRVTVAHPGIYPELTSAQYHLDPAPEPSLSAGIAKLLLTKTPFHAWMQHPRLTEEYRGEEDQVDETASSVMRLGSIVHELVLGRGQGIHVITETADSKGNPIKEPTSYSHKETQRVRDYALSQGWTPCLVHELARAEEMAEEITKSIRNVADCHDFNPAEMLGTEVTAIAEEPGLDVYTRILVDAWGPTRSDLWDLKTTGDLSDDALAKKIWNDWLPMRVAFYQRCVERIDPAVAGRIRTRLIFAETKPPYMVRVVELPRSWIARGHQQVAVALGLWQWCLMAGEWPGYGCNIVSDELIAAQPTYAVRAWDDAVNFSNDEETALRFKPAWHRFIARDSFLTAHANAQALPSRSRDLVDLAP